LRALVTGATGFIGRHVARLLVSRGVEVFALERIPVGRLDVPGAHAVEADLDKREELAAAIGRIGEVDVVLHLAADTRMDVGDEVMERNVRATENLLAALGEWIRGKRFIFASSIAAVDRAGRPRGPLTADSPPKPRSAYALSKLRCEEILEAEASARGFALTTLRLGTVYGPGATKGGVHALAQAVREGGLAARIPWPGKISFVEVGDVAEVCWRLADRDEPLTGTYFLAENEGFSMAEAAAILKTVQKAEKGPLPFPRFLLRFGGFLLYLPGIRSRAPWSLRCALADTIWCDTTPLTEALEMTWTPLAEGLERTFG
jgi:UDP-glucose 4-epimerase